MTKTHILDHALLRADRGTACRVQSIVGIVEIVGRSVNCAIACCTCSFLGSMVVVSYCTTQYMAAGGKGKGRMCTRVTISNGVKQ
jgi:hypothetical protein